MNAYSDNEVNNYEDATETPYYGENMNSSSDDESNNDEVSPNPHTNDVNINANYDNEKNYYEVTLIHLKMVEIMKQLTKMEKK